ncbi:NAD(P)H-binding protein [Nocardia spumae]|uniref:NAD(P)H-binding protein n=1 Tax=Nocardia spumae TaxID=2887190 RepID=UPI001D13D7B7|nr:NAD(P)H-binding protein [Nocardia spumae]
MIAITGATGTIGRVLVRSLTEADEKVLAVSRGIAEVPDAVAHRRADLADPQQLATAVEGAEALFLLFTGPQLVTGPDPAHYLEAVRRAGVERVVLLSSQVAGTRPDLESHARGATFERALRESGLEWTILRPTGFFSNTLAWGDSVRDQDTVFAPFADIALPTIDPADIAAVAAAALSRDGHTRHVYELTGPAAITPRAQVDTLAQALGRPLRLVELTRSQARENLLRFMPPAVADGTLDILGEPLPAEQVPGTDVTTVLGRPATTFADWVTRNLGAFG